MSSSSSDEESPKISDPPKRHSQSLSGVHESTKVNKNDTLHMNTSEEMHGSVFSLIPSIKGHRKEAIPTIATSEMLNHESEIPSVSSNSDNNDRYRCICCPIHKIEMEQLGTLMSSLSQNNISENVKTLIRKQNILTNIITSYAVKELHVISEGVQKMKMVESHNEYESIVNKFPFPIDTIEKFQEAEQFWSDDLNFKSSVHEFSKIGGNSIYEFIKRMMAVIITNNLASKFTWFGTKAKEPLMKSKLAELLSRAAEMSNLDCDKNMVEKAIRKYLRRAKERSVWENRQQGH